MFQSPNNLADRYRADQNAIELTQAEINAYPVRFDMHCHSTASLEKVGPLSFRPMLTPEHVYETAKAAGMDFVTITDHDTIDGCMELLDRRGALRDFIVGEEVSVTFPDDGMIVHVNVYDHNEEQHREIQNLAGNAWELIPYLRSIDKLFVLNHPTWNQQHRPVSAKRCDEFLELFDVFEVINGTRTYRHNSPVWALIDGQNKVMTAGTDSHTDQMGATHTRTIGHTRTEVLANIRAGKTAVCGNMGGAPLTYYDLVHVVDANVKRSMEAGCSIFRRCTLRGAQLTCRTAGRLAILAYYRRQRQLIDVFAS